MRDTDSRRFPSVLSMHEALLAGYFIARIVLGPWTSTTRWPALTHR